MEKARKLGESMEIDKRKVLRAKEQAG